MKALETVLYSVTDGVAFVTLNRPESYNAANEQLTTDLRAALTTAAEANEVRVVVITGAGKAFCSGQDLKDAPTADGKRSLRDSLERRYNPIIRLMREMPKPIIAGINGVAAGAGMSIALAADYRIMSTSARFVEAFIGIALIPDSGATWFYPRMMGYTKAFEFATLNKPITAAEALQMGMVNAIAHPRSFKHAVDKISLTYAGGPTQSYGFVKMLLQRSMNVPLDDMLALEREYQQRAGESSDYREGVAAFVEKRKAKFSGR
ncbi:MAG: enoyl-CoA hydratase/isomerase family protein [Ignavibacteria bacterium]|nr:enoyl-CoA hydratase/isomerase family protein [Ignavibacteria bacterium]